MLGANLRLVQKTLALLLCIAIVGSSWPAAPTWAQPPLDAKQESPRLPQSSTKPLSDHLAGTIDNGIKMQPSKPVIGGGDTISELREAERIAIAALYENTTWPKSGLSPCEWQGVSCTSILVDSVQFRTVSSIELENYPLSREIPSEIKQLSNLTILSLISTTLTGELPSSLGQLTNLTHLNLSNNQLTGTIPAALSSLVKLEVLNLSCTRGDTVPCNNLHGQLPSELRALRQLKVLNLGGNSVGGPFPEWIGDLTKLTELTLTSNEFTGSIPSSIGLLSELEVLNLRQNQLSGKLPEALGRLSKLRKLDLWCSHPVESCNNFDIGNVFPPVLRELKLLESLNLTNLEVNGPIPSWIGELTQLQELHLRNSELTGSIPNELSSLTNLSQLDLSENRLTGTIPSSLGSLINLTDLYLGGNPDLGGEIPGSLTELIDLRVLSLFNAGLVGSIPKGLAELVNLQSLNLHRNYLTGTIPSELGSLSHLVTLDLSANQLKGAVSQDLTGLAALRCLSLGNNELKGDLSPQLVQLIQRLPTIDSPVTLELSGNELTASDPTLSAVLNEKDPNWSENWPDQENEPETCGYYWHYVQFASSESESPLANESLLPSQPIGWLEGKFAVSDDGAATYSLPLWTPQGRGGLQPELSLAYNSNIGNGMLGVGWSLQGLSTITRCPRTIAQDRYPEAVQFDNLDAFCLNGNRLIPVSPQEIAGNEVEYRTERDPFAKIIAYIDTNVVPGQRVIKSFRIWAKDGRILTYGEHRGNTRGWIWGYQLIGGFHPIWPISALMRASQAGVPIVWALSHIEDRNGNEISISYGLDDNPSQDWSVEAWPERITYWPDREILFEYEDRPDVIDRFQSGVHTRITRRLSRIALYANSINDTRLLREYRLGYTANSITERSRLTTIRECDGGGTCLSSLEFQYSLDSYRFTPIDTGIEINLSPEIGDVDYVWAPQFFDVNGDGCDDMLYLHFASRLDSSQNHYYIRFSNGRGFSAPVRAGLPPRVGPSIPRPVDFNRDGRIDLMMASEFSRERFHWDLYQSTGRSYVKVESLEDPAPWNYHSYFADLDGNGLPDYVARRDSEPGQYFWTYALNTGIPGDNQFQGRGSLGDVRAWNNDFYAIDTDGDGRTELLRSQFPGSWESLGLDKDLRVEYPNSNLTNIPDVRKLFMDVNADGLKDAVHPFLGSPQPNGLLVQLNSGRGFSSQFMAAADYRPAFDANAGIRVADFDHDGQEDIVTFEPTSSGGLGLDAVVYVSHNNKFKRIPLGIPAGDAEIWPGHLWDDSTWRSPQLLDIDGNGMLDMSQVWNGQLRILKRSGSVPDRLTRISVAGLGPRVHITYKTLAEGQVGAVHDPGTCSYPQICPTRGGQVVAIHRIENGLGRWRRFDHHYVSARVDLLGRGGLGFQEHWVRDLQTGATTNSIFGDQITRGAGATVLYPFVNLPTLVIYSLPLREGITYRKITFNTYELRWLEVPGTFMVKLQTRKEISSEEGGVTGPIFLQQTTTDFGYDSFGNQTLRVTSDVRTITETIDYENDTDNWLIGQVTRTLVMGCMPGEPCKQRETTYGYDARGNLAEIIVEPSSPELRLRTVISHTNWGLVSSITALDAEDQSRSQWFGYDTNGVYMTSITNTLGQATHHTVHPDFGLPLSSTDPNGLTSVMRYDGFGRIRELISSDGNKAITNYTRNASSPFVIETQLSTGEAHRLELDKFGRERMNSSSSFGGGWASTYTYYDSFGRVEQISRPRLPGEVSYVTSFRYDPLDRLTDISEPDGATIRFDYKGLETHTYDANGNHSYIVKTRDGDIAARYEPNPLSSGWLTTTFGYGPFGEVTRVVAADGTEQTMTFDSLGHRVGFSDPNTGVITSTYNAFGELVDEWDSLGQHTRFEYDDLGRPSRVVSADGTATYSWDKAAHGIGLLDKATSTDGITTQYTYDTLSRPATISWLVEGMRYEIGMRYDRHSRLKRLFYPKSSDGHQFAVTYVYNDQGYLVQAKDALDGTEYWQADARNAAGQIEKVSFGNGLSTSWMYQPETGLLTRTYTSLVDSDTPLFDLGYSYDANRNVKSRTEAISMRQDTYAYDALDRLTSWDVNHGDNHDLQVEYTYNVLGNLLNERPSVGKWSDVTYRYGENGAPPHALTSRNAAAYRYDLIGRQFSGPSRTVEYNTWNLPRIIKDQGLRTEYAYDADGVRVLKRSAIETVVSVPGLYERRVSNSICDVYSIVADGEIVAQVVRVQDSGSNSVTSSEVAYLHSDLQGTIGWISNSDGQFSEQLLYDPFGQRISQDNVPLPNGRRTGTRYGYTGHEHDDELGLINMMGRIYDPSLHRFLTPDPIVQASLFSQSYNRYSYVSNNPATMVDPTGFQAEVPDELPTIETSPGFGYVYYEGQWWPTEIIHITEPVLDDFSTYFGPSVPHGDPTAFVPPIVEGNIVHHPGYSYEWVDYAEGGGTWILHDWRGWYSPPTEVRYALERSWAAHVKAQENWRRTENGLALAKALSAAGIAVTGVLMGSYIIGEVIIGARSARGLSLARPAPTVAQIVEQSAGSLHRAVELINQAGFSQSQAIHAIRQVLSSSSRTMIEHAGSSGSTYLLASGQLPLSGTATVQALQVTSQGTVIWGSADIVVRDLLRLAVDFVKFLPN